MDVAGFSALQFFFQCQLILTKQAVARLHAKVAWMTSSNTRISIPHSHCTAYVKLYVQIDDVSPWFIIVWPMYYLVIIPFINCFIMNQGVLVYPDFFLKFLDISMGCFNVRPPLSNVGSKICWQRWEHLMDTIYITKYGILFVSLFNACLSTYRLNATRLK